MTSEIIIAIVSGIVGLTGGVIAWVQAVKTSRLKADADAALERIKSETSLTLEHLKLEQERRKRAFEVVIEESKPIEIVLTQAWHDIQSIKDVISKYVSGYRFDEDSARASLRSACMSLSENYAKWGPAVPETAQQAWHKAKGYITSVDALLPVIESGGTNISPLPPSTVERFSEMRALLTDCQTVIAASRREIRDTTMKKIMELM
jgi:hypothetical protein